LGLVARANQIGQVPNSTGVRVTRFNIEFGA
jgi:hypothetical protein